ncbi:MAG: DUF1446 domain-containing protein [Limnohabitans sp.]|nr:DUF1446 domain-containing protein [Limnohabitans sp.]
MKNPNTLRLGVGSSFADDRISPAVELAEKGDIDYLIFECLAERTIARENQTKLKNPEKGYTPRLLERMKAVMPVCIEKDIRIVTNMGAANSVYAARDTRRLAKDMGLGDVSCTIVTGDDVADLLKVNPQLEIMESGDPLESLLPKMVSGNAYLGADVICKALQTDAQVIITGRVADPSLFVAPMMYEWGWSYDDWNKLASATACGHLLECCAQVSGGCFADPGKKEVHDLARLGFPFADIHANGNFWVSKVEGTGGRVDLATCKEQLIYELHDPYTYITPDCILDITDLEMYQDGVDRVRIEKAKGRPRTDTYKVTVGYDDGYMGEGQISFAGPNAVAKAKYASQVVQDRLKERGFQYSEVRVDLIGMSSLHGNVDARIEPYEVRLRLAMRTTSKAAAQAVGFETRALHVNGPSGAGGGSDPVVKEILAVQSVLIPRAMVDKQVQIQQVTS